jgi:carboxylesterase type B
MFVQNNINTESDWQQLQTLNFGVSPDKYPTINEAMIKQFPSPSGAQKYKTQKDRTIDFVQFSVFTCNARFITEAYKGKTYNIQYSRGLGMHGLDVIPTFFNAGTLVATTSSLADPTFATFASQYQSYLTSHARTGDPNKFRAAGTPEWPHVEFGPTLSKVFNATDNGFELIEDTKTKAEDCDFWREAFATLTAAGGELSKIHSAKSHNLT